MKLKKQNSALKVLKINHIRLHKRKVERPSYEQLIKEIEELGYCGTGRKYVVSDNTIRKWKKNYENRDMV